MGHGAVGIALIPPMNSWLWPIGYGARTTIICGGEFETSKNPTSYIITLFVYNFYNMKKDSMVGSEVGLRGVVPAITRKLWWGNFDKTQSEPKKPS